MIRRFTLDGEPVELAAFLSRNVETLYPEDVAEIRAMIPGDEIRFGGGAWGLFVLRCEAA